MITEWDKKYKQKWDERYAVKEFAYGTEPNIFFKEQIDKLQPGKILMPADGEGRNGVYAALSGWEVTSIDLSETGKTKALQLAAENNTTIDYIVGDLEEIDFTKEGFDAVGLLFAHFSAVKKAPLHRKLAGYIKQGGIVIFEAFGKQQLHFPNSAGPKDIDMLFSKEELENDFKDFEILLSEEKEIDLYEGKYHQGKSSVVRFIGRKKLYDNIH